MSQHKLNLSDAVRTAQRSAWNAMKSIQLPPDGVYLKIGASSIGRNRKKAVKS